MNDTYAVTQEGQAGVRNGSGSASIKGVGTGMTEGQELRGAAAADREAPYALGQESMKKTASGDSAVTVTFDPVQDRGTEYYFKAESYSMRTGQLLCTSNITKNLLVTGVKGYLYLVDTQSATEVTAANAVNVHAPLAEPEVTVPLGPYPQYLHMAAVDRAICPRQCMWRSGRTIPWHGRYPRIWSRSAVWWVERITRIYILPLTGLTM